MADINNSYYNRYDHSKNYETHRFLAGHVLQSAELNEIQSAELQRLQMLGDALFKDGDIVRDARVIVDSVTGNTVCESGAIYLRGQVRGVAPKNITIPVNRTVAIGIWLKENVITVNEDPELRDPAIETRNFQEQGAARLKVEPVWGFDGDGTDAQFFPVYYVDNGQLRAKEPPPSLDSVTQALARYDRDSAGSNYIVSGLRLTRLTDLSNGTQVYSLQDGRARVNGFGVSQTTARRIEYPAVPDVRLVDSEPHVSVTSDAQRINVDRSPIAEVQQVRITSERTAVMTHGSFSGAQDALPETSVVDIVEVKQGATTYVKGVDYKLTAGRVDWSLSGAEPAAGSSYETKFQFIKTVEPANLDETGFDVTGAVASSVVFVSYSVKLPRIDRLCINESGELIWYKGVATDYDPVRPSVPSTVAPIAQVHQTWDANRRVVNDGVRVVPMSNLEAMNARMDLITDLVAQQKLVSDLSTREQAARKGLFVDPFLDDSHRDQGIAQTAAIVDGVLMLPIAGTSLRPDADITDAVTCEYSTAASLKQDARTGAMKVNPYMSFGVTPASIKLTPAIDRWVEHATQWASPETRQFTYSTVESLGLALQVIKSTTTNTQLVKTENAALSYLRPIEVQFRAEGFGPGETLTSLKFDGIAVSTTAI